MNGSSAIVLFDPNISFEVVVQDTYTRTAAVEEINLVGISLDCMCYVKGIASKVGHVFIENIVCNINVRLFVGCDQACIAFKVGRHNVDCPTDGANILLECVVSDYNWTFICDQDDRANRLVLLYPSLVIKTNSGVGYRIYEIIARITAVAYLEVELATAFFKLGVLNRLWR